MPLASARGPRLKRHDAMPPTSFRHRLVALVLGELVKKACIAAGFVWLARIVAPTVYGQVEWSLSVMYLFSLAADAGLTTWATAQVAAHPESAGALVGGVARLRLAMAIPAYAVLLVMAAAYGGPVGIALAVFGLGLFLTPFYLQYLYNGLQQVRWSAIGNAGRGAIFAALVIAFARPDSTPLLAAIAETAGAAVMVAIYVAAMHTVLQQPVRYGDEGFGIGALLRQSWTVCASELTWGIHWYAGLVLLGVMATSVDAAWQSASLRLILAVHTGVWMYLSVLLPNLARLLASDPTGWARLVERSLRVSGWASLGMAVVGTLGASVLIDTIFGSRFGPSAAIFRVMIWVIPIAWASGHLRYSLIAAKHPRREFHASLVGAGTTIALTLILIPRLGGLGAGIALVGGTAANALAAWILARRTLPDFALARSLALPGVWCAIAMAIGVALSPIVGPIEATAAAAGLFGVAALIAERETATSLLRSFGGAALMKASSNADART
jgi:O-antigen/teichoic acid export membrane protein